MKKNQIIMLVVGILFSISATSCKKTGNCICHYPEDFNGPYIDWNPYEITKEECTKMSQTLGVECMFVIPK